MKFSLLDTLEGVTVKFTRETWLRKYTTSYTESPTAEQVAYKWGCDFSNGGNCSGRDALSQETLWKGLPDRGESPKTRVEVGGWLCVARPHAPTGTRVK